MKKIIILSSLTIIGLVSCKKDKKNTPSPSGQDPYIAQKQQVKETYANLAFAVYDDAYQGVQSLKTVINTFVSNPSDLNFTACKTSWKQVREIYGLTETFRFADGPIDNPADGPEGFINAWPMDEAYVDYVQGADSSGIINNVALYPTINQATLLTANENGGETNISLGFHAIEFLLWGQDFSASSAGTRPYTDYLTIGGTAAHQARRGQYLNVTVDILLIGLKQVRDAWDPAISGNYRSQFLNLDNAVALRKMFNSMAVLSGFELSGERMYTAYNSQSQEDEHSCFSDNTHRDIYLNAKGIENLYSGSYTRSNLTVVSGYALKDLVALYSTQKNNDVLTAFTNSLAKINLMYTPFDQAIALPEERPKVLDAVMALQDEEIKIKSAASAVGINL